MSIGNRWTNYSNLFSFESDTLTARLASLKRRGVSDTVINEALSEAAQSIDR